MGIFETSEEKVLTREIAEEFVSSRRSALRLEEFSVLGDGVADVLGEALGKEELNLSDLTKLSDTEIESLSKFEGYYLILNGLTSLSDAAAESLSKWTGLSHDEDGHLLMLNGITSLSDSAAESLGEFTGHSLNLIGLSDLSDKGARGLSKFEGEDFCISTPTSASAAQILRDAGHFFC